MSAKRLVVALRTTQGIFEIWYQGPIGLRGGRYLIVIADSSLRPTSTRPVVLSDLISLRDHLTEEIERAATLGG